MTGRNGVVLPAVILIVLGLTLAGHAAWIVSNRALRVAEAGRSLRQAELLASSGLDRALTLASAMDSAGARSGAWQPDARWTVAWRLDSLTAELALLRVDARSLEDYPRPSFGRVVFRLDPVARLAALPAAAAARTISTAGAIDDRWWDADPNAACPPLLDRLRERSAGQAPAPVSGGTAYDIGLGLLTLDSILLRSDLTVAGVVSPRPDSTGQACASEEPAHWGDPSTGADPSPCRASWPTIAAPGDLVVGGGVGQGLLAVAGDVTFSGPTFFRGFVLASGEVHIGAGAVVDGTIVSGALRTDGGSVFRPRACPALLALAGNPGLSIPIVLPGYSELRLGPF